MHAQRYHSSSRASLASDVRFSRKYEFVFMSVDVLVLSIYGFGVLKLVVLRFL